MSKRRKDRRGRRGPVRRTTLVSNRLTRAAEKPPPYRQWPIVRAYVPLEMAWQASGFGQAGIVRRRPDGDLITSFFHFSLLDGGLQGMVGKDQTNEAELDQFVADASQVLPAMQVGSSDVVARYVWGAYALSLDEGFDWPAEQVGRYLGMVPLLSGRQSWWVQQFVGDRGLAPAGLWEIIEQMPRDEDIPEDKELVLLTTVTFELNDRDEALNVLRSLEPDIALDFEDDQRISFSWTRKYPKEHWSPLRLLGGRQILGSLQIEGKRLIAEAKTLSMTSILVARLHNALGANLNLLGTRWVDPHSLFDAMDEESDESPAG